jgi:hypothetical protein
VNQPFLEEFKKEQEHLLSLPVHPYELGRLQYSKVNKLSLISVDGNFYSVPDYVEKRVLCNVYSNQMVYIFLPNMQKKMEKESIPSISFTILKQET